MYSGPAFLLLLPFFLCALVGLPLMLILHTVALVEERMVAGWLAKLSAVLGVLGVPFITLYAATNRGSDVESYIAKVHGMYGFLAGVIVWLLLCAAIARWRKQMGMAKRCCISGIAMLVLALGACLLSSDTGESRPQRSLRDALHPNTIRWTWNEISLERQRYYWEYPWCEAYLNGKMAKAKRILTAPSDGAQNNLATLRHSGQAIVSLLCRTAPR